MSVSPLMNGAAVFIPSIMIWYVRFRLEYRGFMSIFKVHKNDLGAGDA